MSMEIQAQSVRPTHSGRSNQNGLKNFKLRVFQARIVDEIENFDDDNTVVVAGTQENPQEQPVAKKPVEVDASKPVKKVLKVKVDPKVTPLLYGDRRKKLKDIEGTMNEVLSLLYKLEGADTDGYLANKEKFAGRMKSLKSQIDTLLKMKLAELFAKTDEKGRHAILLKDKVYQKSKMINQLISHLMVLDLVDLEDVAEKVQAELHGPDHTRLDEAAGIKKPEK